MDASGSRRDVPIHSGNAHFHGDGSGGLTPRLWRLPMTDLQALSMTPVVPHSPSARNCEQFMRWRLTVK